MPCLTVLWIHFATVVVTGALLINRWRYCRISNRCNILIKGTTFLELASTCFMLSSLQDVNASKKIKRKEKYDFMAYLCLLVIKCKPLKIFFKIKIDPSPLTVLNKNVMNLSHQLKKTILAICLIFSDFP
jgi:hypothetical protein